MNIRERILKYLEYKGITRYKFYKDTGLSNGFLDKKGTIGADKCEKICYVYTDISIEWLMTGKGEMLLGEKDIMRNESFKNDIEDIREELKLRNRLDKANKLSVISSWYSDIDGDIDMISNYLNHYNVMINISDTLKAFRAKKINWDEVMTEFKKRLEVTMELYKIIRPYENVIKEIYEKVSDFNDKHDRLYRFDDIESNTKP